MKTSRREFISLAGVATAGVLAGCGRRAAQIPGAIVGASAAAGHRLRDGKFPSATENIKADVVVVGGGIAGLSAARRLDKLGLKNFILLDLEAEPGGNAASGRNAVSAYPWGAHYVPLVNSEAAEVAALFEELGIIRGKDTAGLPVYNEEFLCSDPMERLLDSGRWQEGLLPQIGISAADLHEYDTFFARMDQYRQMKGTDGRNAFAIPVDLSSRDPELIALDSITMEEWMTRGGWTSAPLRWHVDYSCRDDYGAGMAKVSAWAGIHYFASRRGQAANADRDAVVTWPEGNGWLVNAIAAPLKSRARTGAIAWNIEQSDAGVAVDYFDLARGVTIRIEARGVVCAAPRFIASRIVKNLPAGQPGEYSPWMVANVTIDDLPEGRGFPLAWDNVCRDSASLGYVVATHQDVRPVAGSTVLTHYWPLDQVPPRESREIAIGRSHAQWCEMIVADLEHAHSTITPHIQNIDIWLWGHGMIRPVPGYIWGEARKQMLQPFGNIVFAHSDMSGISIFEEAFTHGTHAADTLFQQLS